MMKKQPLLLPLQILAPQLQADVLFSDSFNITAAGAGSVGFLDFSLDSRQELDIFTDGPTLDPQIFLFQGGANGLNPSSVLLAADDDSCPDGRCGPAGSFNNALIDNVVLEAGEFTVAVSDFPFNAGEAIAG
ncbi:MAG: DVUA0089 family protein [Methylococcales bacterium]|nr:DVUA0089 family protein [Methylococcales bacterium]